MIFRQLFETDTSTYSYLLGCERSRKAVLIDSVVSEIDHYIEFLQSLNLKLIYTLVTDGVLLQVGDMELQVRHTPGHTNGCVSYVMADRVFTGDALLINGCGRTDFQQGSAEQLYDSITGKLFSLPPDTLVYPGHDYQGNTVSTIKQEVAKNSRLGGGRSREDFISIMHCLNLAYPKYIDQALPANHSCGLVAAPQN
jgi:glyoxylase-like metal-dependent hydrolase (beta-lactamase superfamily II)